MLGASARPVRSSDEQARFLTVIEPYENRPAVTRAEATGADSLRVELADGCVQQIQISGLESEPAQVGVTIVESRGDQVLRWETTETPGK